MEKYRKKYDVIGLPIFYGNVAISTIIASSISKTMTGYELLEMIQKAEDAKDQLDEVITKAAKMLELTV